MMFAGIIHAKTAYLLLRIALDTFVVEKNLLVYIVNFQVNTFHENLTRKNVSL
jgi:hypothetical protein